MGVQFQSLFTTRHRPVIAGRRGPSGRPCEKGECGQVARMPQLQIVRATSGR